jgi:hypothetical protein
MIHDRSVIRVKPDPEVRILAFSFMSASITRSSWRAKLKIGNVFGLEAIQGAGSTRSRAFHDMEVDHGGGDVGMAEKVLDGADVGAGFEQVRGERMAKGVRCDAFRNARFSYGLTDLAGHGVVMQVVAGDPSSAMNALKILSYVGKLAGFVAALDAMPFILNPAVK